MEGVYMQKFDVDFAAKIWGIIGYLQDRQDPRFGLYVGMLRNNRSEGDAKYQLVFEQIERFDQLDLYPIMQRGYRRADGAE